MSYWLVYSCESFYFVWSWYVERCTNVHLQNLWTWPSKYAFWNLKHFLKLKNNYRFPIFGIYIYSTTFCINIIWNWATSIIQWSVCNISLENSKFCMNGQKEDGHCTMAIATWFARTFLLQKTKPVSLLWQQTTFLLAH